MKRLFLLLILLLAFALRVLWLDRYPVGFTPDEASFGYDAYSIWKTGKDQWGKSFPLVLKSFGDYKSPLYAYLTIPSVAVFGLSKFSVRLPNAILGTMAVLVVYLLVRELTKKQNLAVVAALLLAVSSWHIMLSRGAFEANLITFFLPWGIYLFLRQKYNLAALVFGLNLFTYHSAKLITPIVFPALILITKKVKLYSVFLFSLFLIAMFYSFQIGGGARVAERSIFQGALEEGVKAKFELIRKGMNPTLARLLHNKYQVVAKRFINNYFQYFSWRFLFIQGPAEATYGMVPGLGVLYLFEGVLLLGLVPLMFKKELRVVIWLVVGWLLISPLPAALSTGVGYAANRAAAMISPLIILETIGVSGWSLFLRKLNKKLLVISAFVFAFIVFTEIAGAAKIYFQDLPRLAAKSMLYGNLEVATWLKENSADEQVIVSRALSEPHIYFAFANVWDPAGYQKNTRSWNYEEEGVVWVDQMQSYTLSNYFFQGLNWEENVGKSGALLVGKPGEFPKNVIPEKIIYYPDGTEAVYVVDIEK